jgi:two-component system, cell cycle sensor histidine kinase and response regulator CckA
VHPDDQARIETQVKQILERGSSGRADFRLIDADNKIRWLYVVIVTVQNLDRALSRVVFTMLDITARKQLELEREALQNQVARTQKEESLGNFAGGVAHDLNNLLTTAFGHVDLVKLLTHDDAAQESLNMVDDTLSHMAKLSRQMLAYAGRTPINPAIFDLNACLEKVHSIMAVSVGKKAKFALGLSEQTMPVYGEESQTQQIALNLLLNAAEALEGKGGDVRLGTAIIARAQWPEHIRQRIAPRVQQAAVLSVSDTGRGMSAATMARMFEPFFTEKFAGRGLGLSVVDGLVRGHGGGIDVQSTPGHGTLVSVYFPLEDKVSASSEAQAKAVPNATSGIILVVDDETALRNLICRSLNAQGFETLSAANGDEAIEQVRAHPEINAVVLDLTMPNKDGLEVYLELQKDYPKLKVMLMSGYSEQSIASKLGPDVPAPAFLNKPFRVAELLSLLSQVLSS